MNKDKIARIVSTVTTPIVTGAVLMIAVFSDGYGGGEFPYGSFFVLMVFTILVPLLFTVWLLKNKKISNFHMKKREERMLPFIFTLGSSLVGISIIYLIGINEIVLKSIISYLVILTIFLAITSKYKLSGHTFFYFFTSLYLGVFISPYLLLLLLAGPLVGWSRIYLKDHTKKEVLTGLSYALLSFACFYLFN